MSNIALYIHWPFCKSKCPYCDFNSHVRERIEMEKWQQAYLLELERYLPVLTGKKIVSIFFGGGTPSLMPPAIAEAIISYLRRHELLADQAEITLEANPTSVEADTFVGFKQAGINRFSLGVQSLNQADLKFLGRGHSVDEAVKAIGRAAECTENYSFDLIYTRPNQTVKAWKHELREALGLACKHLSLYQLTIEKGTEFYRMHKDKVFKMPEDDISRALYEVTQEELAAHGLPAYEISNHAMVGYESRHNLMYWRYQPYLGIGPGAHSRLHSMEKILGARPRLNIEALTMIYHPEKWLEQALDGTSPVQQRERLTHEQALMEMTLMGLRLAEGISLRRFKETLGITLKQAYPERTVQKFVNEGLLVVDDSAIRTTDAGRMVLNHVVAELLLAH